MIEKISPLWRFAVEDKSMEPDFHSGDFLLVNKLAYKLGNPGKKDVIVLRDPREEKCLLKRVIAGPGERVFFSSEKVIVNGSNHLTPLMYELEKDEYFVVGDNLKQSKDSRFFGPIKKKDIIGKVISHGKKEE